MHSHNFVDLTGLTFNRLRVIRYAGRRKNRAAWFCVCSCGTRVIVTGTDLKRRNTRSCGCLRREQLLARNLIHGQAQRGKVTQEYRAYQDAKKRCTNPLATGWNSYGGRGIKFLFHSFNEFIACVGPKPSRRYELDRIDVNGNYAPGNLRWVTKLESRRNQRKVKVTADEVRAMRERYRRGDVSRAQLADQYGITLSNLKNILYCKTWNTLPPKKPSASVRLSAAKTGTR